MARTRSTKPAKSLAIEKSTPEPSTTTSNAKPLPPSSANPPKALVLPKNVSPESRIVTLDNPANGAPSRYLFCPENGFYEFTRICAPKKMPRSWLITSDAQKEQTDEGKDAQNDDGESLGSGYITKNPDLFIATPIDTLFLALPALAPKSAKQTKQHFLALDDYLDTLSTSSPHFRALLSQHPSLRTRIEKRLSACCDSVDAGDEKMYRLSLDKLLAILVKKAEKMCERGFPSSMEDRFIKPALEIPVMSVRREELSVSIVSETQESTTVVEEASDSQTTATATLESQTTITTLESQTTATTTPPSEEHQPQLTTPPTIPPLLRLRQSLTYLLHAYIPATLRTPLLTLLNSPSSPLNLTPLENHLATLSTLRAEAQALRSISDNISRKRGYQEDDEEKAAEREEKKRKKEEEEKRKKGESRSIKQLKKVDTSGMKKLSSFFTKAPAKKA